MNNPTEKLKALTHFVIHDFSDKTKFGSGKREALWYAYCLLINTPTGHSKRLNEALWHLDSVAHRRYGKPITESKYVRRAEGPVPVHILATLQQLQKEKQIHIKESEFFGDPRIYMSSSEPRDDMLSDDEREFAREILFIVSGASERDKSEILYDSAWKSAQYGEEISLFAQN